MIAATAPTGLSEGEVCIYTDEDESGNMHRIILKRERQIEMRSGDISVTRMGQNVVMDCQRHDHAELWRRHVGGEMMARIAVGGDLCGGLIVASGRSTIDGAGIARIGDLIAPHGTPPNVHAGARIVSGSFPNFVSVAGAIHPATATTRLAGMSISASNTTDDSSRHWAPQPPTPAAPSVTEQIEELDIEWAQGETYPGHSGTILQWHGPGEEYDASRQFESGLVASGSGTFMHTIMGLTGGDEYTIRVIATRRFAIDGTPSAEMTGIPLVDPNMPGP